MQIKLRIEGKVKAFTTDFISGRTLRRSIEITEGTDLKNISTATLDTLVDFIVDLYGKQFSRDDVYDGIDGRLLLSVIIREINDVIEGASKSVGADPDDPNFQQET